MKSKPTLIIADDHAMFLDGLRALLSAHYEIIGEAADGPTLIGMAVEVAPDIIISDFSMPGMNGLQVLHELGKRGIESKSVLLTMHAEPEYAAEAIAAGASGYVLKNSASAELISAIDVVLDGGVYLPPKLAKEVFGLSRQPNKPTKLTERHREVLKLLADGLVAKEIGDRLDISPRTVEYHKYQLLRKLGMRTTAELIHYAVREGIAGGG